MEPLADPALALARQLLLFAALLAPLELLWPARTHPLPRPGWATDLAWAVVNTAVLATVGGALLAAQAAAGGWLAPSGLLAAVRAQPAAAQLVELLLLAELTGYAAHRLSHRVPLLWRVHAIHHSATHLGWLSAHRQHPLDALWLLLATNLPLALLGFEVGPLAAVILLQKLHTAWVHANTRLPEGRWERWLAGPRFHRWHHARGPDTGNYAALLPGIDAALGTLSLPPGEPAALGTDEAVPAHLPGQLLWPARRAAGPR